MAMRQQDTVKTLLAAKARTTNANGSAVDLQGSMDPGVRNIKAYLDLGTLQGTAGTTLSLDVKIQDSATTTSGDFTDISGAAFTQLTTVGNGTLHFVTNKRYVRAVATIGTTLTNAEFGVFLVETERVV